MVTLHTYGDSHASPHGGWDKLNIEGLKVRINHLGPKLMFSFGRDNMMVINNMRKEDYVIFCLGEIDCRCHVGKYVPNVNENIEVIVNAYVETIKNNVSTLKPKKVLIYNVVPPIEREAAENLWMVGKSALPTIGTDKEIKNYTLYMNQKLKELSEVNGFTFFDVYEKYTNDRGFLMAELSDGNCHIKDPKYIREEMVKILNNGDK